MNIKHRLKFTLGGQPPPINKLERKFSQINPRETVLLGTPYSKSYVHHYYFHVEIPLRCLFLTCPGRSYRLAQEYLSPLSYLVAPLHPFFKGEFDYPKTRDSTSLVAKYILYLHDSLHLFAFSSFFFFLNVCLCACAHTCSGIHDGWPLVRNSHYSVCCSFSPRGPPSMIRGKSYSFWNSGMNNRGRETEKGPFDGWQ